MYNNQIIGGQAQGFNPYLKPIQQARASGVVTEYKFLACFCKGLCGVIA